MLAMRRAVQALGVEPEEAWIDGNSLPGFSVARPRPSSMATRMHPVISAASILAKTERDAEMCALSRALPAIRLRPPQGLRHRRSTSTRSAASAPARSTAAASTRWGCSSRRTSSPTAGARWPRPLRVRSYRMYCGAKKLAAAPGLTLAEFRVAGAPAAPRLRRRARLPRGVAARRPHGAGAGGGKGGVRLRPAAKAPGLRGFPDTRRRVPPGNRRHAAGAC